MKEIIKLEKITKEYNHKLILDQVDLSIYEGQSMVFTGHNGSGKSTLLKIISGLVKPSDGKVIYRDKLLFHYVPERFPKMNLTPWQYLKRMGQMDGIPPKILAKRCEKLFSDFFLPDMVNIPMKDLSKGTLQKIGVIQALLRTPQVLLLDEPLSGQDMDSQMVFIEKMNELSGFSGSSLGEISHPRINRSRKTAVIFTFLLAVTAVTKAAILEMIPVLAVILWVIPPISDVTALFAGETYFSADKCSTAFIIFLISGMIWTVVKIMGLKKKGF